VSMLRIAVVQMGAAARQVDANLRRMLAALEEAHARAAELVCFPELCVSGYLLEPEAYTPSLLAESAQAQDALAAAGRARSLTVVYGAPVVASGALRNAVVLQPPATERLVYAKTHMDALERRVFAAGERFAVDEPRGLGLACCYDLAFPEPARVLALAGARALLAPMAWEAERGFVMDHVLAARAVENVAYVVAVNQVGRVGPFSFRGRSRVVDPHGRPVCDLGEHEGVETAELDLEWVDELRRDPGRSTYELFADRRPELYGGLAAGGYRGAASAVDAL
jgi:predicted amidohydrolase